MDLWSLDTEGAELAILNTVDWTRFRADIVVIEDTQLERKQAKTLLMEKAGYVKLGRLAGNLFVAEESSPRFLRDFHYLTILALPPQVVSARRRCATDEAGRQHFCRLVELRFLCAFLVAHFCERKQSAHTSTNCKPPPSHPPTPPWSLQSTLYGTHTRSGLQHAAAIAEPPGKQCTRVNSENALSH